MRETRRDDPVQVTNDYLTDVQMLAKLNPLQRWSVQIWELDDSVFPIASAQPDQVLMRAGGEVKAFWPPAAAGRRGRGAADIHFACDVMAEQGDDNDDGEELSDLEEPEGLQFHEDLYAADALELLNAGEGAAEPAAAVVMPPVGEVEAAAGEPAEAGGGEVAAQHDAQPQPDDAVAPPVRAQRPGHAVAEVTLPNGRIAFHALAGNFECRCRLHQSCVVTRTCNGRVRQGELTGGRPVAFMAAWLEYGRTCTSKAEHMDASRWEAALSHQARVAWRERIQGMASGAQLLEFERELAGDEPAEEQTLLGYMVARRQ